MNLNELDNFNLNDAINFHTELNPQLFVGDEMRPPVRSALLQIAQDFIEFIGITDIALVDITVSGSNAAYSYTPHSDIDLHLIVDFDQLSNDEIYRELFDAKKYQYNEQHDIKVKGYDVEVYVQAADQRHSSLGEYSINRNDWNKIPTKHRANLSDSATKMKFDKLRQLALQALASDNHTYLNNVLDVIKRYRSAGLADGGEFGPENLAFKMLRKQGLFQKLWDKKRGHEDRKLSLEHDTTLEEVKQEFNNSREINEAVKLMYKRNPGIFDRYSFDTVYAGACKLVEDGRIVKGVNTTQDVGVDQIKIEAGKLGFNVTRDGRPPLLRESIEMLEDVDLLELKMSPGRLRSEIGKILQSKTPVIGLEMEVCWTRDPDDEHNDSDPEITWRTDWEDLESFFEYDTGDSFSSLKASYEEWLLDKGNEWVETQLDERLDSPREEANEKIEFMVDHYTLYGDGEEIVQAEGKEEIDNELAKKILLAAEDFQEKVMKPPSQWVDTVDNIPPLAELYQYIFKIDEDEAREYFQDKYYEEFYGNELAFDDENYTIGVYLSKDLNYSTMKDLFFDYSDYLTWPGGSVTGEVYDDDIAERIASDFSEMGIDAEATGEYHSNEGNRTEWNIEEDTTIDPSEGDAGFEIISPPLEYTQGIDEIKAVVNYLIDNDAYTNPSTGLHINVSVKGVNHADVDYPKLILMLGDKYISKQFDREINQYTLSALDKMSNVLSTVGRTKSNEVEFAAYLDKMRSKVDKALASSFANELKFDKYTSVHFRENHVEFRAAGGVNYLEKFDQVINTINRCIFAYVIAADPEAYKNEYAKKLYKLTSTKAPGKTPATVEAMKLFALAQAQIISKEELMQKLKGLNALRKVQKDITQTAWPLSAKPIMAEPKFQEALDSAAYTVNRRWGRELNQSPEWFRQQLMYGMKEQMLRLKEAPPNIMKELLLMLEDAQEAMLQDPRVYERRVQA